MGESIFAATRATALTRYRRTDHGPHGRAEHVERKDLCGNISGLSTGAAFVVTPACGCRRRSGPSKRPLEDSGGHLAPASPMPGGPPPAPFDYHGQRVNPMRDQDRLAWGFWFLGTWIPL